MSGRLLHPGASSGKAAWQEGAINPLKCLSDAEEECPRLFSWPTLELETVVEPQHDEWVSYAEPESASASEVRESEV